VRIDAIEQALRESGMLAGEMGPDTAGRNVEGNAIALLADLEKR
jgi:hypothetical protein